MTTEYKEIDIIKSKNLAKKYTAILIDSKGKKYYIDFGDSSKGHYQDRTKLKHFSYMDMCYTNMGQQLQKQFAEKKYAERYTKNKTKSKFFGEAITRTHSLVSFSPRDFGVFEAPIFEEKQTG